MKNIFKKVLVAALVLVSGVALVACGSNEELEAAKKAKEEAEAALALSEQQVQALEQEKAELESQIAELEQGAADYEDLVAQYQAQIAASKDLSEAKVKAKALIDAAAAQFDKSNVNGLLAKSILNDPTFDFSDEEWNEINNLKAISDFVLVNTVDVDSLNELAAQVANGLLGFFACTGAFTYVDYTYAQRAEILGVLEQYAVNYGLTGLTMYQTAGYALYNEGVQLGTQTYIVGYGFGALSEGAITKPLAYEGMNENWGYYYHTYEVEDPGHINYADDKGSVVGDLQPYMSGSYWGTKMNDTKDGYVWCNDIALTRPQAEEEGKIEGTSLSRIYSFEVPIGDGLRYSTLSKDPVLSQFNNRTVAMEDYLTPFKYYFSQSTGWARSTESFDTSQEIVGSQEYYEATKDVAVNEEAFKKVGIKIEKIDDSRAKITYTFKVPCNSFYAMYYFNSSFYAPVPQDFIDALNTAGEGETSNGAANYQKFVSSKNWSPVDTSLSTGPFVLESWVQDSEIVFKQNENYTRDGYDIKGVHIAVLSGQKTDVELAFKEFMAGKLSSAGVPSTQLDNYRSKTEGTSELNEAVKYYVKQTFAGSTFKLNFNTLDQTTWYKFFGENGTIAQTPLADSWECEPILSNHDFYLGLSYALDRKTLADKHAYAPAVDYFGDSYLADPENGIAYNSTDAHKRAISSLIADEDHDGYDVELARSYFKKACDALLEAGVYQEGDVIELEFAYQEPTDETEDYPIIKKCFEEAFNDPSVCGGKLTLQCKFWVGAVWSDVYYAKMMVGQFDIGFGSISGNALNPLNFFEVLKSDNSSGFTLNWGADTSVISEDLVWDGKIWSFDSLWLAADQGAYFDNGVPTPAVSPKFVSITENSDGTQTLVLDLNPAPSEDISATFKNMSLWAYDASGSPIQTFFSVGDEGVTVVGNIVTVVIDTETLAEFADANLYDGGDPAALGDYHGFDVTLDYVVAKVPTYDFCVNIVDDGAWIK